MFLRDGGLVVITGEEPVNGELAVFALSAVLELRGKPGELTGKVERDLANGVTAGTVPITPDEWRRVVRRRDRGDYITLRLVGQRGSAGRRFKWGFAKKHTVETHYLSDEDKFWLAAWIEATTETYQTLKQEKEAAAKAAKANRKTRPKKRKMGGKKAGRKGRRRKQVYGDD